jgi:hypothetical protein
VAAVFSARSVILIRCFVSQLLLQMRSMFCLAGVTVASHKDVADKLMIIVSGRLLLSRICTYDEVRDSPRSDGSKQLY